jgi:hypothetical protein
MRHRVLAVLLTLTGCAASTTAHPDQPPCTTLPAAPGPTTLATPTQHALPVGHIPEHDATVPAWQVPDNPAIPVTPSRPGLPVPALPPDLSQLGLSSSAPVDVPAHDDVDPNPTAADVASAWLLARHATRSDDIAPRRFDGLDRLSADPTLAAATDANTSRADAATNGGTWAVVRTVTDVGDGWWRVDYAIKTTGADHVGPTSLPAVLDVHVSAGQVHAERP